MTSLRPGRHSARRAAPRRRSGHGAGHAVLLVLLAAAAFVLLRAAGLFSMTGVPKENIETDFGIELTALTSMERYGQGGGDADTADAEALRALAKKRPRDADRLNFIADNIGDFSNNGVKNVLKSPEVSDFVLRAAYGPRENRPGGAVRVHKGSIPYFVQYDSRWAFAQYGSSYMGYTACGPTCLAMCAAGLTGNADYTPEYVANFAERSGYYVDGTGTSWSLFTDGAARLGLRGEAVSTSEREMKKSLKHGALIASMSAGDFTNAGHFIVIVKSGLGGFTVYDPSSTERSGRLWSYRRLAPQIAQLWAIDAN